MTKFADILKFAAVQVGGAAELKKWAVFGGEPKGKKARRQVQEAFNVWASKSQINRAQMSRILALSVD